MKYLIGVDEGTTGCKAAMFNESGELICLSSREYRSYYPAPGWVEQDLIEIENAVFDSCAEVVRKAIVDYDIKKENIVGISHSNQGITMALLDSDEKLVFPHTIGWQDLRYVDMLSELKKEINNDEYWETSGMNFGTYNVPVLRWIEKHNLQEWKKIKHICSHQDYFLRRYGANGYYIDEGNANFLSMVNRKTGEWDDNLMDVYHVNDSMLSKIVHTPGMIVGNVSEEFSLRTGMPRSCVIASGGLDTNACSLAAGASDVGVQVLIMGTAGVSIFITDNDKLDSNGRITTRSNPGFNNFQNYIMTNTGASAFRWFRDALCDMESTTGRLMGVDPYDLITKIAAQSKPGANDVIALTCIQGSHTRIKNEKARGTFLGINLGTTKADLAEAILEGICFEMKDILQMNENLSGEIKHVRLCGGVAKSPMWCQMFADVLNRKVEVTEVSELGALGAAMYAGIGAGIYSNCEQAIQKCVRIKNVYSPVKARNSIYEDVYKKWENYYRVCNEEIYI